MDSGRGRRAIVSARQLVRVATSQTLVDALLSSRLCASPSPSEPKRTEANQFSSCARGGATGAIGSGCRAGAADCVTRAVQ